MNRVLLVAFVVVLGACAGRRTLDGGEKVTKAGIVSVWATWVKDKEKKFDVELNVKNESDKPIIILLRDMTCQRGTLDGKLKHTFFNTGERTIDFTPRELKHFKLVCDHRGPATGPFRVAIGKVYENPENDGKTKGKVVATDIVWTASDKDAPQR